MNQPGLQSSSFSVLFPPSTRPNYSGFFELRNELEIWHPEETSLRSVDLCNCFQAYGIHSGSEQIAVTQLTRDWNLSCSHEICSQKSSDPPGYSAILMKAFQIVAGPQEALSWIYLSNSDEKRFPGPFLSLSKISLHNNSIRRISKLWNGSHLRSDVRVLPLPFLKQTQILVGFPIFSRFKKMISRALSSRTGASRGTFPESSPNWTELNLHFIRLECSGCDSEECLWEISDENRDSGNQSRLEQKICKGGAFSPQKWNTWSSLPHFSNRTTASRSESSSIFDIRASFDGFENSLHYQINSSRTKWFHPL
jgi:hypothetical protein